MPQNPATMIDETHVSDLIGCSTLFISMPAPSRPPIRLSRTSPAETPDSARRLSAVFFEIRAQQSTQQKALGSEGTASQCTAANPVATGRYLKRLRGSLSASGECPSSRRAEITEQAPASGAAWTNGGKEVSPRCRCD